MKPTNEKRMTRQEAPAALARLLEAARSATAHARSLLEAQHALEMELEALAATERAAALKETAERILKPKAGLKALTIWQPWAWAVATGLKPVENREWEPPAEMVGQWIAIHAGKTFDDDALPNFLEVLAETMPAGQVPDVEWLRALPTSAVIGVGRLVEVVEDSDSPWFVGPFGWRFEDVVSFAPVPCRGQRKLWELPAPVLATVRRRFAAARRVA